MTDYTEYINERLGTVMAMQGIMEKKESEESDVYVNEAPKIKGYFKLISIRYMKRMRDIKKMCIEYINTYVASALNVAKNMDDVSIVKEQDKDENLANELNFSAVGASTDGEKKKSDTKEGVLFLSGDKALLNKMNAIIEKIKLRAEKNKMLMEWSALMIAQSKITANDIIRKETCKLLKEEKTRKEQERKAEENAKKKQEELNKKMEEEKKKQKNKEELIKQFGDPTTPIKKIGLDKKGVKEMLGGITNDFFGKELAGEDGGLATENCKVNETREKFYSERGREDAVKKAIEFASKAEGTAERHYLFSTYMVGDCEDMDKKPETFPCPVDIMIASLNNPVVKIPENYMKPINGIDAKAFKNDSIDSAKLLGEIGDDAKKYTENEYGRKCILIYIYTVSAAYTILENKDRVLSSAQFIAESDFNSMYRGLYENAYREESAELLADVLNDYGGGIILDNPYEASAGNVSCIRIGDDGGILFLKNTSGMDSAKIELTEDELGELSYYIINNY